MRWRIGRMRVVAGGRDDVEGHVVLDDEIQLSCLRQGGSRVILSAQGWECIRCNYMFLDLEGKHELFQVPSLGLRRESCNVLEVHSGTMALIPVRWSS